MNFDVLVIGWGKAGKTLAARFAAAGKSVALAEKSPAMYGGTCINVACVPTKDLAESAHQRRASDDPATFFDAAVAGRDALITKLNAANHGMLEGKATLFDGTARFVGPKEVAITTADGEVRVSAETIIIGTGATPLMPSIRGIDGPGVYDSTTIQHASPFPEQLVIVGGGFVALEFADMFTNFGSQVTVLDRSDVFLPHLDRDVAQPVHDNLTQRGVVFHTGVEVNAIEQIDGARRRVVTQDGAYEADAVLAAVGRVPATADLALDVAGIATDERGFITVDDQLRTNVDGVFAVGDVNGGPQFTYISLDDNRIVYDVVMGAGRRRVSDRLAVPTTTFLTPPLSQVGLTPQQASLAGHDVLVARKDIAKIAAMPRPKIMGETTGFMSFTVDAQDEKILGATIYSIDSQELINMVALAIRLGATVSDLRDGIWTHPSSTEAFNEVLGELAPYRPDPNQP